MILLVIETGLLAGVKPIGAAHPGETVYDRHLVTLGLLRGAHGKHFRREAFTSRVPRSDSERVDHAGACASE